MTHPIIKTDNYILITSDEEIKEGDYWHYLGEKDNPVKNVLGRSWFEKLHDVKMYKKVIAHLPLNNSSILEGVPILPPLPDEEDFDEKLLTEEYEQALKRRGSEYAGGYCEGFKCAMETSRVPYGDDGWKTVETGYKIINGVMQGKWIFE